MYVNTIRAVGIDRLEIGGEKGFLNADRAVGRVHTGEACVHDQAHLVGARIGVGVGRLGGGGVNAGIIRIAKIPLKNAGAAALIAERYAIVVALNAGRKEGAHRQVAVAHVVLKITPRGADELSVAVFLHTNPNHELPDDGGHAGQETRSRIDGEVVARPAVEHIIVVEPRHPIHQIVGRRIGRVGLRTAPRAAGRPAELGRTESVHQAIAVGIHGALVEVDRLIYTDIQRRPVVELRIAIASQ